MRYYKGSASWKWQQRESSTSDSGSLLTDGDVDAVELLDLTLAVVPVPLVEDGIRSCRFDDLR